MQRPEFYHSGLEPESYFDNTQSEPALEALIEEKYIHDAAAFRRRVFDRFLGLTGEQRAINWMKFDVDPFAMPNASDTYTSQREILVLSTRSLRRRPPAIRIITNELYEGAQATHQNDSEPAKLVQIMSEDFILDSDGDAQFSINACLNDAKDLHTTGTVLYNFDNEGTMFLSNNFKHFPKIGALENDNDEALVPFGMCTRLADKVAALEDGQRIFAETESAYPARIGASDK
jgi:hypothetical protein